MNIHDQYRAGYITSKEYEKSLAKMRQPQQLDEETRQCMTDCVSALFCCPCAKGFVGEDEECVKFLFATSLSGIFYGGITTALSAGLCGVSKSSTGLGIGITSVVVGILCTVGWCYHVRSRDAMASQSDLGSIPAFTIDNVIIQQPQ